MTKNDRKLVEEFGGASELVFWTFRYFLGRRTLHTHVIADALAKNWHLIEPRLQDSIRQELDREFERDDRARKCRCNGWPFPLGHNCDRVVWERVRAAYGKDAK